jgi:chromate transporter
VQGCDRGNAQLAHEQGEGMSAVPFSDAFKVFLKIGCLSFGGPAGQIALLHRELVDDRKWLEEKEFLGALNFCMLLPGPEAMQLATYAGWRLHGIAGGLVAGLLFVLPGALVILALSLLYATLGQTGWIGAMLWGLKAAVIAIVLEALMRVAKKALKGPVDWVVAGLAFVALFAFNLPFPLIVLAAGLLGLAMPAPATPGRAAALPPVAGTVQTIAIWLAVWLLPLGLVMLVAPPLFGDLAQFFSKLAVVTFGGAYAVLTYMGQDMVETYGWLTTQEMMHGLALAETTPGPLILVGQFAAFMAAAKPLGLWGGVLASVVFLWMTFAPCFLWIFAGAPWISHLQSMPRLSSALAKISAAVVGVILNLALWFALHALFGTVTRAQGPIPVWWPNWGSVNLPLLALAILLGFGLLKWHWGIPKTLGIAAAAGLLWFTVQQMV